MMTRGGDKMKSKSLINSFWLVMEKIISMVGLFLVSAFVAKYIGPALVGKIALAVASFQIVMVVAQFGSENIIIRRLSRNIYSGVVLARISLLLRSGIYIIVALPVLWYSHSKDMIEFVFFCSVAVASFFTTIDVVATYNDTTLNSKINAVFNVVGLIAALILRFFIAELKLNPLLLTIPIIVTTVLPFLLRLLHFARNGNKKTLAEKTKKPATYLKYLVITGSSMLIANISVAIYPRINLFFLSGLSDAHQLGIYSVAVTLATSWSFVVLALVTSYFPAVYNEKNESAAALKATELNIVIAAISLCVIVGFAAVGKMFISLLYGPAFADAWLPALILCVGTMLSTMGAISSRYILKTSGYRYLSCKSFIALILCVPLSFFFITYEGIVGAAVSVVVLEFISLTLLNYGYKKGTVLKMHLLMFGALPGMVRRIL
ncbi:MAG: hypothetical protein H6R25_1412 [Proteobacteria bacterium]|nr:hypothetical protein [Pseudomonadota bacterium]